MTSATHICLDCEAAARAFETTLRPDGTCNKCGSQSVIDINIAQSLAEKTLRDQETKLSPARGAQEPVFDATHAVVDSREARKRKQSRIDSLREFHSPIRRMLLRAELIDVDQWWDGWSSWSDVSFSQTYDITEEPAPSEYDWVRLVLTNSNGEQRIIYFHFDPSLEDMRTINVVVKAATK